VPPTAANPLGLNNGAGGTWLNTRKSAWYGTLFTNWFDGKIATMSGVRWDHFWRVVRTSEERIGPIHAVSKNPGGVWHVMPKLGLYYGYSDALKVNTATSLSFFNEGLPPGRGRGRDAGVKVDLVDNRLSGSVAVFKATAENESDVLVAAVRDVVDPTGINGKFGGPNILFDRETRGLEVALNARPLPRWNLRVGLNWINGKDGNDLALPI
jgi:outer membrane receptor for ferric coprogen and ferric-rhodotorulic acid